ncbi:MAG: twin-arginine translocase subunit TatB [Rhodobacteraceae bacterium]|nr:twin-arginine translocase subunit TatB [Paracoccaceae bacterium]
MLDIGLTELLVIGIVALIVVGPKDLPGLFRSVGQFTARARAMAREFSRSMEDAARESGLDEARRDLREMTSEKNLGLDKLSDTARQAARGMDTVRKAARGDVKGLARDVAARSRGDEGDEGPKPGSDKPAPAPADTARPGPSTGTRPRKPAARKAAADVSAPEKAPTARKTAPAKAKPAAPAKARAAASAKRKPPARKTAPDPSAPGGADGGGA